MSSTKDKVKGHTNETVGKVKEGIGKATGNSSLEGEGVGQQVKGKAQQLKGDVKDAIKRGVDKA